MIDPDGRDWYIANREGATDEPHWLRNNIEVTDVYREGAFINVGSKLAQEVVVPGSGEVALGQSYEEPDITGMVLAPQNIVSDISYFNMTQGGEGFSLTLNMKKGDQVWLNLTYVDKGSLPRVETTIIDTKGLGGSAFRQISRSEVSYSKPGFLRKPFGAANSAMDFVDTSKTVTVNGVQVYKSSTRYEGETLKPYIESKKMNMKNMLKYFTLLVFIFLLACNRNGGLELERQVREFKRFVSEEPFSHLSSFNNTWSVFRITNPSALYALGYCGLYFQSTPDAQEFVSIASKLENNSVIRANLQDSSDFFVPNFKVQSPKKIFPIPRLDDPFFNIKDSVDVQNSVILGFKQERGNFFTEKGVYEAKKFANPQDHDKIGNGYSNGAIVDYSSKKIIYWIIVW